MSHAALKIAPAISALLIQALSLIITAGTVKVLAIPVSLWLLAWTTGFLAMLLSRAIRLAPWWLIIQLLFLPAALFMLNTPVPREVFLGLFLLLLLVYWSTFRSQVPLYLSSRKIHQALEQLLPDQNSFTFIDLGCGLGGVITHLAERRPDGCYEGIELAPLPFLWAWLRVTWGRYPNCKITRGSFWDTDLSRYDVVFAYLSPAPMAQLWVKVKTEMRPGTVFISSTFTIPGATPDQIVQTDDLHESALLVWRR